MFIWIAEYSARFVWFIFMVKIIIIIVYIFFVAAQWKQVVRLRWTKLKSNVKR